MPDDKARRGWSSLGNRAQGLNDEQLLHHLKGLYRFALADEPAEHPLKQPQDPSVAEFMAAWHHGLTEEQRQRWGDSPYCALLLRLHWRSEPPAEELRQRWEAGLLRGFE